VGSAFSRCTHQEDRRTGGQEDRRTGGQEDRNIEASWEGPTSPVPPSAFLNDLCGSLGESSEK